MHTIFVTQDIRGGSVVHSRDTEGDIYPKDGHIWPLIIIADTEYSDYSGGSVQASNHRHLLANEEIAPYLVEVIGNHGYKALAYEAYLGPVPLCEALAEVIGNLESYCLVDEDDHSELESELEQEAWDDYGLEDFKYALVKAMDAIDPYPHSVDDESESSLRELWNGGCDGFNVNGGSGYNVETGCNVHFYTDEWCTKAKRQPDRIIGEDDVTFRSFAEGCRAKD